MISGIPRPPRILALLALTLLMALVACNIASSTQPPSLTGASPAAGSAAADAPATTVAPPLQIAGLPQTRAANFQRISVSEGLSESVVNDIVQDHQGFLWFATQDGLNRFDGYSFSIYKSDPNDPYSLSQNNITRMAVDPQGQLWIGTYNAGLNRFDPLTGRSKRYLPDDQRPEALLGRRVSALLVDHTGVLWVATENGLNRYDPQKDGFDHFTNRTGDPDSLQYNNVLTLLETRDGTLWVGTGKGLDQFDRLTGKFKHYTNRPADPNSLANNIVYSLAEDAQGRLWVGTVGGGLDRLERAAGRFVHYRPDPARPRSLSGLEVMALRVDHAGVLWAGINSGGLCQYVPQSDDFTCYRSQPADPTSLSANNVFAIYEDRAGILWIGTFGGGISKLDPGYKPFVTLQGSAQEPNRLGGRLVFALAEDAQKNLWVGTDDGGLDRVDRAAGTVTHFRSDPHDSSSLSSDKVHALFLDHTGQLWAGTSMGLNRFDAAQGKFIRYPSGTSSGPKTSLAGSNVSAITEDSQGALWVATSDCGLNRLDPRTDTFTHYCDKTGKPTGLADHAVTALRFDQAGILWAGTQNQGLERFDPRTEIFTHFPSRMDDPTSLSDMYVLAIYEDHSGTLWVGTTNGLNRLDPSTGTFRVYRMKDGLPNDFIYAIQEDGQGRLWMSTNKGLSRFDVKAGTFKNFDVKDGLQSDEFNTNAAYRAADGELFFGGIQGVTAFYPDQIRDNPYVPPVVLTSLIEHGDKVRVTSQPVDEIIVRWPDNYIDFEFASLNYIRPELNRYAYKLEGFDRAWNVTGAKHSGRYTNLPGGAYTLRLKGSNNDGVWNETGTAIRVRVIPPFWATWWFRGAAALLVLGSVAGGVRWRVRSVESRNTELERLVRARTAEIERLYEQTKELAVVEERNRLARDLHDSAKQKAFAALAQMGAANGLLHSDPPRAYQPMREAETLVYEVIEELTFLIQEMYPVALKEKGLATVLREYIYEWGSRSDVQVNLRIEQAHPLPLKTEQAVYRIIQEGLANVARHSQASQVTVSVLYTPDQVTFTIEDNGRGFDLSHRPAGVGLRSMQERITMIGGVLTIESAPGCGTRLCGCVPGQAPARE